MFLYLIMPHKMYWYSFKIRPGGSTRDPADPGLESGRVEEKTGKEKTRCDPVKNRVATR
jgi:hypothetical protein